MEEYLAGRLHSPVTRENLRMVLGWQLDRAEDPETRANIEAEIAALEELERAEAGGSEAAVEGARAGVVRRLAPRVGVTTMAARTRPVRPREIHGPRIPQSQRPALRVPRTRSRERRPGRSPRTSSGHTRGGDPLTVTGRVSRPPIIN